MNIFNFFKKHTVVDLDERVLQQLKKYGSDLAKPHKIDFFLYFSDIIAAENVKNIVQKQNPEDIIKVEKSVNENGRFLCQITRTMVPDLTQLQDLSNYFRDLSSRFGGNYDGWGAEVEN